MAAPLHGQVSLSGTAQQLDPTSSAGSSNVFIIKAPVSNKAQAFLGASTVTSGSGHALDPGDEITYERIAQNGQPAYEQRPSDFWVVGSSGDVVSWLALR